MAAFSFALDVRLDGHPYIAARGQQGERQFAVTYVPKIKASSQNAVGDPTLDPLEYVTYHRGAGASRSVGVAGMIAYTENGWTIDPGLFMPGPEVTAVTLTGATVAPRPDGVVEQDGHIFVAAGRYVFKLTAGQATAPTPSQDLDLGGGNTGYALKRFGTSIFLSSNGNLYERPDGGAWTNALLGANPVAPTGALGTVWWTTGVAGAEVSTERLVAQFGARGLRYCATAPRNDASWTPGLANPAIDVGAPITRFATTSDHLYVSTPSGLRDLDVSGRAPNLIPEAEQGVLSTGGLAAIIRGGIGYVSAAYELYRVAVAGVQYAVAEVITPMALLANETPVGGYGTAILARGKYLIYAQYDPILDTTWVSWGREPDTGQLVGRMPGEASGVASIRGAELGPYVWNVAPIVLHGFKVTSMHISGLATDGPRLWLFGTTAGGAISAKWAPLAYTTPYADLKSGRARRFTQSCFMILPSEDGGEDAIQRDVEEILEESENLSGGNSIRISAAKEGESTFTTLATFTSGPRSLAQVPTAFISQRPTFRIDLAGTPVSPPISRRTSIRWLPIPDVREVRRYMFDLGRAEFSGSGSRSGEGAEEAVTRLVALANSSARATFSDEAGNDLIVRVLKVDGPAEVAGEIANDRILALAVTMSIFGRAPGPPFGYDAGTPWDSGHSWS